MYYILDSHTQQLLPRTYKTRARANRFVDKLNNEYGAYRYYVTW